VREFLYLIVQLSREDGITVLLSSHHLHQVQQVCDRVGLFVGGRLLAEGNISQLSAKLFRDESFTVSAKVRFVEDMETEKQRLLKILQSVSGVLTAQFQDGVFQVDCFQDVTDAIARAIVENGFALVHLHQKEYGLDEIYHRYFEGEQNGKIN